MSTPSAPWLPAFTPEHPYDTYGHAHEDVWAGRWIDMGTDVVGFADDRPDEHWHELTALVPEPERKLSVVAVRHSLAQLNRAMEELKAFMPLPGISSWGPFPASNTLRVVIRPGHPDSVAIIGEAFGDLVTVTILDQVAHLA